MLESWHAARADSRAARRPKLLRIAIASTLPTAAAMQWIANADIDIEISEGTSDAVEVRWRRGRCDGALFATRGAVPQANATALFREPFLLAAANDRLVATRDRWSVRDLANTPFVLRAACEAGEEATRLFAAEDAKPRAVLRSADEERRAAAVLSGLGVCLMPRSLLRPAWRAPRSAKSRWGVGSCSPGATGWTWR
jgi:DNA-binding transcriptional LysR family regulator